MRRTRTLVYQGARNVSFSEIFVCLLNELSPNKVNSERNYVVFCAIWYYLYNLKNVKKSHGGVLLL